MQLNSIINNMHVELGGKKVNVEVEVVDRLLDYNILLGRPWVYAMLAIVSTYFRMIAFPYKGAITVINQLSLFASNSQVTRVFRSFTHPNSHFRTLV